MAIRDKSSAKKEPGKRPGKEPIQIRLADHILAGFEKISAARGVKRNALIQQACAEYLERQSETK